MPGQNPFTYQPHPASAHQRDPREGFWGRSFRNEDIELPPDTAVPPVLPNAGAPSEGSWSFGSMFGSKQAPSEPMSPNMAPPPPQVLRGLQQVQVPEQLDPERTAPLLKPGQTIVPNAYSGEPTRAVSDMSGGTPESLASALSGLQAAQQDQFSPFSERELTEMSQRPAWSVKPGSNEYWANQANEMRARHASFEDQDMKTQGALQGAIASGHPAVVGEQQRRAMAASLPAQITARGQLQAAQVAGQSRLGAAQADLAGTTNRARMAHLDTIMDAIRGIRGKANVTNEDTQMLRSLMALYDLYGEPLTGATFDESADMYGLQ